MTRYDAVPWSTFLPAFDWAQGEHVIATAPTGGGKTVLLSKILPRRKYQVVFATKGADKSLDRFVRDGYRKIQSFGDVTLRHNKYILWPAHGDNIMATYGKQKRIFQDALNAMYSQRNWTVVCDEYHYMCESLNLEPILKMYQHQGRSMGLTVVAGFQRPAWVPVVTYSGATHAFIWKTTLEEDMKRLSNLGGINARELKANALELDKHEFIYVNTRTGADPVRSQVRM